MFPGKRSFTLIELIIVVVIIGILALIAIPRYFANVTKARKNAVYANLHEIRKSLLDYYAIYAHYPTAGSFPITATIDGDTVLSFARPSSTGAT
ncbi:MAG: prepilin-type N-terminal cleavage/methylation domain-containing protein [Candidatus Omnitrophota bacterium]